MENNKHLFVFASWSFSIIALFFLDLSNPFVSIVLLGLGILWLILSFLMNKNKDNKFKVKRMIYVFLFTGLIYVTINIMIG